MKFFMNWITKQVKEINMLKIGEKVAFIVPGNFQYGEYRGKGLIGKITKINKKTYSITHSNKDLMINALIKKEDLEKWNTTGR